MKSFCQTNWSSIFLPANFFAMSDSPIFLQNQFPSAFVSLLNHSAIRIPHSEIECSAIRNLMTDHFFPLRIYSLPEATAFFISLLTSLPLAITGRAFPVHRRRASRADID